MKNLLMLLVILLVGLTAAVPAPQTSDEDQEDVLAEDAEEEEEEEPIVLRSLDPSRLGALTSLVTATDEESEEEVDLAEDNQLGGHGDQVVQAPAGVNARAAARTSNCLCQCSPLTYVDQQGQVQGNCRSADDSGVKWCFVDSHYSQCIDLKLSRVSPIQWSYEACATPALTSPECQQGGGNRIGGTGTQMFPSGGVGAAATAPSFPPSGSSVPGSAPGSSFPLVGLTNG